jgi:hypothetical protein
VFLYFYAFNPCFCGCTTFSLDLHQSVEIDGFFREYFANFACCEKQNKAAANPSAGFIALNKNIFDE